MRGKDGGYLLAAIVVGITPAHAGKRFAAGDVLRGGGDHPRPCGEKQIRCFILFVPPGSPPPMRGKANQMLYHVCTSGITPAHAGKSAGRELYLPCGLGSPPPMRGKACTSIGFSSTTRITPAHAGKRETEDFRARYFEDHPRPCGEKPGFVVLPRRAKGSPPPMRGKARFCSSSTPCEGITPAHAGKSRWGLARTGQWWDHPRPCGEKRIEINE